MTELAAGQDVFWASKEYAMVIIFQALDAAGKDSTIKHVMSGVNPQGVSVHSFKAPTEEERLHHFLWRPMQVCRADGMIAIFNRSYYEEVLVVRVHPEFLEQPVCCRAATRRDSNQSGSRATTKSTHSNAFCTEQNTPIPEVLPHMSRKEEQREAISCTARRPGKELEVFAQRYPRTRVLGRIPSRPTKTC